MALTTLTAAPSFDAVRVPNNGTKVVAVSASDPPPSDEGPIRPSLQALVNRDEYNRVETVAIEAGARSIAALMIDGVGGVPVAPAAGTLDVAGNATVGGFVDAIGIVNSSTGLTAINGTSIATVAADLIKIDSPPARPVATDLHNTLVAEVFPRAWGIIYTSGLGGFQANFPDGIGFTATVSIDPNDGANYVVAVTLARAMASTRYHVGIQALFNGAFVDATSIMVVREVLSQRTTSRIMFKAWASAASGAVAVNCNTTVLGFSFTVFGRQN